MWWRSLSIRCARPTFRGVLKFTADVRGDFALDLARFGVSDQQDQYLALHSTLTPVEGCIPTVERVARLGNCGSDGIDEVAHAFLDVARACGKGNADHDELEHALAETVAVHFDLDIHPCYDAASLRRSPAIVTDSALPDDDGPWPPGTSTKRPGTGARCVGAGLAGPQSRRCFDAVLQALPRLAEH